MKWINGLAVLALLIVSIGYSPPVVSVKFQPASHINTTAYTNIMPLGDSITFGYGGLNTTKNGYREELWFNLRDHTNSAIQPNFIGHCGGGPVGAGVNNCLPENPYTVNSKMGDWNHEGHSGWKTEQLRSIAYVRVSQHNPKYVLLLTGANDLRLDTPVASFKSELSTLLDNIYTANPLTHVFVATPTYKTNEPDWDDYVRAVQDLVPTKPNTSLVPLHIIGQKSGELFDGVHPTVCGYSRIRYVWIYYMARFLSVNWTIPNYPFNSPPVGSCKGVV